MQWLVLFFVGCVGSLAFAADTGKFIGKVAVEWLDDDPFVPQMKLIEDFGFQDATGKTWLAPKGHVLDGRSIPLLFRDRFGPPFVGGYRKTSVLYDYYCHVMAEPWKDVHRMFHRAIVNEGMPETDAKIMYMVLYAGGSRWEIRGSRCYGSCHAAAASLTWRPVTEQDDLKPVEEWIRQAGPSLDQIDERLDAVIKKPGPHIFVQVR